MHEYEVKGEAAGGSFEERGTPEQLAALYGALARAQAKFNPIHRSKNVTIKSDKGAYSFAYAPLEDLLAATRQALAEEGLAVLTPAGRTGGAPCVRTILSHQDGARLIATFEFQPLPDIKQLAGQFTYLRRYGYSALLNLASDDDADDEDVPMPSGVRRQSKAAAPPSESRAVDPSTGEIVDPADAALQRMRERHVSVPEGWPEVKGRPPDPTRPTEEDKAAYKRGMDKALRLGLDLAPFEVDEQVSREDLLAMSRRLKAAIDNATPDRQLV